jgi:hypothetical protein
MNARHLAFLAAVALAALSPSAVFAHHCKGPHAGDPGCDSGGGDGGGAADPIYLISVDSHAGASPISPLYDPPEDCLGTNPDQKGPGVVFAVVMPRHHECTTVVTSEGYLLTDDIRIAVNTDGNGDIVSVRVNGQDIIGKEGLQHQSDVIAVAPQTPNLSGDFTLHVDADNVTIWRCNTHTLKPNTRCEVPVGTISLGDITYVLQ